MAIFNNPYPILSNSKGNFDNISAKFNCTLSVVEFSDDYYSITNPTLIINLLLRIYLKNGVLEFIVVVESKPFFRRVFRSEENQMKLKSGFITKKFHQISQLIYTLKLLLLKNLNIGILMRITR